MWLTFLGEYFNGCDNFSYKPNFCNTLSADKEHINIILFLAYLLQKVKGHVNLEFINFLIEKVLGYCSILSIIFI